MSDEKKDNIVLEILDTPFAFFKDVMGIKDTPTHEERQTLALEQIAKNGK